ncbi:MAG: helix-turn-helix domain-containing protein [Patescibacteria group bacterium]
MIRRKANNQDFLDILGLSSTAKQVLLDIVNHGTSSVADISTRLGLPKSTIYDAVTPLLDQSLINEYSSERGKTFGLSDSEQLTRVHKQKLEEMSAAHTSLLSFIKDFKQNDSVARPKIKFYSGILGIKQAFRDISWQKDITETFMLWPTRDMIGIDEAFFRWHGTQRFKYNVFIYAVEKHEDRKLQGDKKHEWLKNDAKSNLVEVRYLPKGVDCKMSFWLYGNKVLFASGGSEKIAFTIHSKEFAQMMKLLWQSLWMTAKK